MLEMPRPCCLDGKPCLTPFFNAIPSLSMAAANFSCRDCCCSTPRTGTQYMTERYVSSIEQSCNENCGKLTFTVYNNKKYIDKSMLLM